MNIKKLQDMSIKKITDELFRYKLLIAWLLLIVVVIVFFIYKYNLPVPFISGRSILCKNELRQNWCDKRCAGCGQVMWSTCHCVTMTGLKVNSVRHGDRYLSYNDWLEMCEDKGIITEESGKPYGN